jgi:hypothetical protein
LHAFAVAVERLYGEMDRLEGVFQRIGGLLQEYKLKEAYEVLLFTPYNRAAKHVGGQHWLTGFAVVQVSGSVGLSAVTFAQYVRDEIRAAEAELVCCVLHHTPTHSSSSLADLAWYLFGYVPPLLLDLLCCPSPLLLTLSVKTPTATSFVLAVFVMLALVVFLKKKPQTKQSLLSKRR